MPGPLDDEPLGPRAYRVAVARVGGQRHRQARAGRVALLAVVALLALGAVSSRLFPVDRGVSLLSVDPSLPIASGDVSDAVVPSPVPSSPLTARISSIPVDVAALIASIPRHGIGPLAFVAGRLHSTQRLCAAGAPVSSCLALRIDGIRAVKVVPDDSMSAWPGDPRPGQTLVLLPRDGRLVYLGALTVQPEGIPRIDILEAGLTAGPASDGQPASSLLEADGLLLAQVTPCSTGGVCGGTNSALFAAASRGEGGDLGSGVVVRVASGALEAGNSAWQDPTWLPGPFLLRYEPSEATPWQVVAREDQGSILHVVIP